MREAELRAEKVVETARAAEASIQADVVALKRMRRQLAESLRSTVEMYQRLLDPELKSEGRDEADD